ncbi:MAG: 2-C-methyl-D-erythritol 4-phosphate cytidylyltransferase [Oscillospiraceae bacterium]|nr:2-C-methyl-D-erythritol 4-phosphate cytidylyltransferase [Oscillospiraceae bacterium]
MKANVITRYMRKVLPLRRTGVVIVAAGSASRMCGIDKVMAPLGGGPMILKTVTAFQNCDAISEIVIVTRQDLMMQIMELCAEYDKVRGVVVGGATRQESVEAGIAALSKDVKLIAVHDGARPLVSCELIDRVVRAANTFHAAVPVIPVKDTIKFVQGGVVKSTPDRSKLFAIQTPQAFDRDLLCAALKKVHVNEVQVTDDSSAVEYLGFTVKTVDGDEKNLKVTTPIDLKIAEFFMEET